MHIESWYDGWHLGLAWVEGGFEIHLGRKIIRFGPTK